MAKKPRRGRRPGQPATKDAILRTARVCFAERGYDAATVRAIALTAGVDQALIHHYFGTKRALFNEALAPSDRATEDAPTRRAGPDDPGEALILAFLQHHDAEPGACTIETLLRAAGSDGAARRLLSELIGRWCALPATHPVAPASDLPRLRATLAAAQLVGLAWMRYVERREPLVSASPRLLARTYGPSITAALVARKS
jgi:AcrR family transcriptional regulator